MENILNILLEKPNVNNRWIEKNYPSIFFEINNKILKNIKWKEKYFLYLKNMEIPNCPICGNELKFISILSGYREFCSRKCTSIGTKDKKRSTMINRYGVDNPMKSEEIRLNYKKSIVKKYGVDNISKDESIKISKRKTMLHKYGVEYNSQREEVKTLLSNRMFLLSDDMNFNKSLSIFKNLNKKIESYDISLVSIKSSIYNFICNKCVMEFSIHKNTLNDRIRYQNTICTLCNKIDNTSNSQDIIYEYIRSIYSGEVIINDRHLGFELDIYLPSEKIAFEYNGIYWHSDEFKDKNYHYIKTKKCDEYGIKLIHIWEDYFLNKRQIVLSRINNLLGSSKKIYARKCKIGFISNSEYKNFVEENHLQGYVSSKYNIGLKYNGELVSIMSFGGLRKSLGQNSVNGHYELLRLCNKIGHSVIGGASRMLKFFIKDKSPIEIISYADRSWSSGSVYHRMGFKFDHETIPNYFWVKNGLRYNRFSFRKDLLVKNGADPNLSESKIMKSKGYYRIYDSGNLKFTLRLA
jgi:hypothetical protein